MYTKKRLLFESHVPGFNIYLEIALCQSVLLLTRHAIHRRLCILLHLSDVTLRRSDNITTNVTICYLICSKWRNWRPISQVILINLSKLNIQCKLADFYYIMSNEIKYLVMCIFIWRKSLYKKNLKNPTDRPTFGKSKGWSPTIWPKQREPARCH
jgi:hypothetical protein